ncbi:TetR/AcrR family transcriptional regulator [Inquilinus limosus]|uniref:TetR/AcrR family transcriptional regulator n=1 Tax=Inquilinus limosus TaxID=171674 RepID=UPI000427ACB0|nr:TetR/AcrR family transcriptional regulator [Inquilinus limosus]
MAQAARKRRKEARPAELLDAAFALFVERGFAATRMEDIAARAGVSKGTVYLYFPSKQAVFEALVRQAVLPNVERLIGETAQPGMPVPEILARLLRAIMHTVAGSPLRQFPRLIIAEAPQFPELAQFWRATVIDRMLGTVVGLIERGIAAGEIRPVDPADAGRLLIAPLLMAVIWGSTFVRQDESFDLGVFIDRHLDIYLRGIAAEAQP